ncbi:MAG: DUF480 domain-containing protein [Gammaproteobacteria bacterium]
MNLNATEARILGSLIEKQAATPETYPLTVNALVTACNQKTAREPVMNLSPGQIAHTLRDLAERELVRKVAGARAERWEHRMDKAFTLTPPRRILLGLILLRGPQTLGELLLRSDRMCSFRSTSAVQEELDGLIEAGHVVMMPRRSGQRENRYMHLLSGEPTARSDDAGPAPFENDRSDEPRAPSLADRVAALEARVAELEEKLGDAG